MTTWKALQELPLYRPALTIESKSKLLDYGYNTPCNIHVRIQFGDKCKNGHNTFTIGIIDKTDKIGGCCHDIIATEFPEYSQLIQWHLCSTDGPLHYMENTMYWAREKNLEYARSTAIDTTGTLSDLIDHDYLVARLPKLMNEFARVMYATFGDKFTTE